MVNNWPYMKIEDIGEVKSGKRLPKGHSLISEITPNPYIRLVDIYDGKIRRNNIQYLDKSTQKKISKYIVETNDVVLAIVGHTIGMVFSVDSEWNKSNLTENAARITNLNENIFHKFLYYYLLSPHGQQEIFSRKVGSAQGKLPLYNIKSLEVPVPPLLEQKSIAHILGTIDDKIELNRQINETLEAMAQALFKSWFVDFDPVIDNALLAGKTIPEPLKERAELRQAQLDSGKSKSNSEINDLFPSEFEFTEELGWIPKGWNVGTLNEIAHHVRDNVKADDIKDNDIYVGLEHIDRKNIFLSNYGSGDDITSNKSAFKDNDILFGKLRPYFHKVCIAPYQGVCSTDILVFRPKNNEFAGYLTLTLFTEKLVEYANMRSTGTRMPRANAKDILNYHIPIIPTQLAHKFNQITSDLFNKGLSHQDENETLAKLRDTLLPKLMSGELRIADAEQLVEDI